MKRLLGYVTFLGVLALAAGGRAHAGIIPTHGHVLANPPSMNNGFGEGGLVTPNPNNDNSMAASPNQDQIITEFGAVGIWDYEWSVRNSGGTTEYFFDQTQVLNSNTGVDWNGYRHQLGFGGGAGFIPSNLLDSLDFDTPDRDPTPTSNRFATLNHQDDILDWSNGVIPNGDSVASFTFSLDVPDWSAAIPVGFETRNRDGTIDGYRFTLRQFPQAVEAAPEPGTLALTALGMLGLVGYLRKQKKQV